MADTELTWKNSLPRYDEKHAGTRNATLSDIDQKQAKIGNPHVLALLKPSELLKWFMWRSDYAEKNARETDRKLFLKARDIAKKIWIKPFHDTYGARDAKAWARFDAEKSEKDIKSFDKAAMAWMEHRKVMLERFDARRQQQVPASEQEINKGARMFASSVHDEFEHHPALKYKQ